jgi:hypothetical protein
MERAVVLESWASCLCPSFRQWCLSRFPNVHVHSGAASRFFCWKIPKNRQRGPWGVNAFLAERRKPPGSGANSCGPGAQNDGSRDLGSL